MSEPNDMPDFSGEEMPQLEPAAFHGIIGEIVVAIGPYTEAHPAALLFTFLTWVGCMIGRLPHMMLDGQRHGVNLFALLVGPTSSGRKGTALARVRRFLRDVDEEFVRERTASGLSSGEGLIEYLAGEAPADREDAAPEAPRDPRLFVPEPEFASVLTRKRREGNTLTAILRQAWDGNDLRTLTRASRGRAARDPHVSIVGHIVRSELRLLHDDVDVRNGFLNRFLFAHVERSKFLPEPVEMPAQTREHLTTVLAQSVAAARLRNEMRLTDEARPTWRQLYLELATSEEGELSGRAAAIVSRIAMLYAVLDNAIGIGSEHLRAAHACWRYSEASARMAFGDVGLGPLARRLNKALSEAGVAGLTRTAIRAATGSNNLPANKITAALDSLRDAGLATFDNLPSDGGRRTERWRHTRYALQGAEVGGMGEMGDATADDSHISHPSQRSAPARSAEPLRRRA